MRHRTKSRHFDRDSEHRKAMFRNLLTSLIMHEHLVTTDAKVKELKKLADKAVILGKKGSLHAKRLLAKKVFGKEAVTRMFDSIAVRFTGRVSGFTRIVKIRERKGDGAPMSLIEFLPAKEAVKETVVKGGKEEKESKEEEILEQE
jgi:large subunit ribosomal protein L17